MQKWVHLVKYMNVSHAVHIVLIKGNDSGIINMSSTFPNNNR